MVKQTKLEKVQFERNMIEKEIETQLSNLQIIGVYWTGNTMRIVVQFDKNILDFIHNCKYHGNEFFIKLFCKKLKEKYPILKFEDNIIIWNQEESISNLFQFEESQVYYINISNSRMQFEDVKYFFRHFWKQKNEGKHYD